jgi:hypothetical protein
MTSPMSHDQILHKHTIIDMFCSKWISYGNTFFKGNNFSILPCPLKVHNCHLYKYTKSAQSTLKRYNIRILYQWLNKLLYQCIIITFERNEIFSWCKSIIKKRLKALIWYTVFKKILTFDTLNRGRTVFFNGGNDDKSYTNKRTENTCPGFCDCNSLNFLQVIR